ncbi:hypothetical protein [Pseudomonas oryzihabitans]|uniref:hypothetical protein n=1 Tax=Pseudomonas oryzihabitans TaxID=47885 RepID=UPI002B1DC369|nr:hypothetical protein [Pseudomonas oryzihabitans]
MDNAATRVLAILLKTKEANEDASCLTVWKYALETEDDIAVLGKIGKFLVQSNQAAEDIKRHFPNQSDSATYWQNQILVGMQNTSLSQRWAHFTVYIDNHVINYLQAHSALLSAVHGNPKLSSDSLSNLERLLNESLGEIRNSTLTSKTKLILSKKIIETIESINDYKILGFEEVFDNLTSLAGNIAFLPNEEKLVLKENSAYEKITSAVKIGLEAYECAEKVASIMQDLPKLIGNMP